MLKERSSKTDRKSRLPNSGSDFKPTRIKEPVVDRWFMAGVYILLTTFLVVVLLPLIYILASSFSDPLAVSSGQVTFWPINFTLEGYQRALSDSSILTGFGNS